jgi:hypothetical protein
LLTQGVRQLAGRDDRCNGLLLPTVRHQ